MTMTTALARAEFALPEAAAATQVQAAIAELGGGITPFDLERISFPSGGTPVWAIEDPVTGEADTQKTVEGWVVAHRLMRSYWEKPIGEGGGASPPDCTSNDSVTGVGTPGGSCESCPLAQFGSAPDGGGQACKQSRLVMLLRSGQSLPTILSIPPSSLKKFNRFALGLIRKGLNLRGVIVRFELQKSQNKAGIAFAELKPSVAGSLEPADVQQLVEAAKGFMPLFTSMQATDLHGGGGPIDLTDEDA